MLYTNVAFAGNTPCTATPVTANMTVFQTFTNTGNGSSGIPFPGCGVAVGPDFWFEVTATGSGTFYIGSQEGTITDAAMAIYEGPCSDLTQMFVAIVLCREQTYTT
jgi:hypothetical protein